MKLVCKNHKSSPWCEAGARCWITELMTEMWKLVNRRLRGERAAAPGAAHADTRAGAFPRLTASYFRCQTRKMHISPPGMLSPACIFCPRKTSF